MKSTEHSRQSSLGGRHFFTPPIGSIKEVRVRGVGVREEMPPCFVERPHGTSDWLIMLFHDPVRATTQRRSGRLLQPETLMVWPPGVPQYYGNPRSGFCHTWIHCEGRRVTQLIGRSRIPLRRPLPTTYGVAFQQCAMDVHQEMVSYLRPDMVRVGNLLENSIREIRRGISGGVGVEQVPAKLLEVRQLIGSTSTRSYSLSEMAERAGMSVSHFSAQFKHYFGLPPMECLIRHRMNFAAHLLGDKSLRISEVGEMSGYGDPFHFSKMFRKHHGVSPRLYRLKLG